MNSRTWNEKLIGITLISLYFLHCLKTANSFHFIDTVNLIFHEAGHSIFMFFGEFIHVLMGSGFQIFLPLFLSGYFFYTGQKISASVCLMWVGENFLNVSVYAGDAINMALPLLGGDGAMHDWNYLLNEMHILYLTPKVAGILYTFGFIFIFLGMTLSYYFLAKEKNADHRIPVSQ